MSDPNNSGNDPQQQINWSGNIITSAPQGQWITISLPSWITTLPSGNLPDLSEEIVEVKTKKSDGCTCKKCGEFYPYADPPEPNKFNCYGCRLTW